jgi:hypothetical protein
VKTVTHSGFNAQFALGALVITISSATDDLHPIGLSCEFLRIPAAIDDLSLVLTTKKRMADSPALFEWKSAGAISLALLCRVDRTIVCVAVVLSVGRKRQQTELPGEFSGPNGHTESALDLCS